MPEQNTKTRIYRRIAIVLAALLALAGLTAAAVWLFVLPYRNAQSRMLPDSAMTLQHRQDGSVELSWPAASKTDFYQVEVLRPVEIETKSGEKELQWETLHSAQVTDPACVLPALPWDEELTIRVNTMVYYDFPGGDRVRPGEEPLETTLRLQPPAIENLAWTADPDGNSVTLIFEIPLGGEARLFWCDDQGQWQLLRTIEDGQTTLTFGEGGDLPMLEHGQTCRLQLDALRENPGSVYFSRVSDVLQVIREDLLDRNLALQLADEGDNSCTLTWNETKGETYELQMKRSDETQWVTIHTVEQTGDRTFTTEHLKAFRSYQFRVRALGGQAELEGSAVVSDVQEYKTREAVLYSTIWPIKELEVFDSPDMTQSIGTVAGGCTLCVVQECDGAFGIRYADGVTGYIDSNYCMIDLPDYLGELCSYDITNSYDSIYKIHGYAMPQVTGTVIVGYENVRMADGTYLAPLLYPVAQKLLVAAQSAYEAGYRLKIYDSYRPNRATVILYDRAEKLLEQPVPGNVKAPTEEDPERLLTYGTVMTNDVYPLTFFLARGGSLHNQGIAVDLSMELLETGEEQPMQSRMHDLSYFSMIYRNNDNAMLLKGFMEGAGLVGLTTEWWHFQDDAIRQELMLPFLWGGVSPEGWKLDDTGWRYRLRDGTYATACTMTIEQKEYAFDAQGYLTKN